MTRKMIEHRLIELNLLPCLNHDRIDTKKKYRKMVDNYYLALEGLKKLNSEELDALNNVIESINHKSI